MPWTDERIECLKAMWAQGSSPTKIADKLGNVSRNAVIGKAHRLGLQPRPAVATIKNRLTADASSGELASSDQGDAPLIDLNDVAIKKLLARAKKRGVITYDELNKALPQDQISSEQIEDVMSAISEMGVNIVEAAEATDDPKAEMDRQLQEMDWQLQSGETVFDLIERKPPEYDARWVPLTVWTFSKHPASSKLTVSFREFLSAGGCYNLDYTRKTHFPEVDDDQQLSVSDAQAAGCDLGDVIWATGMVSAYSPAAAARLTEFAADCLQVLADQIVPGQPEREMLLDTVGAARDFAAGQCSVHAMLREITNAQKAWMRVHTPLEAGIHFSWDRFFTNNHQSARLSFLPPMWEEWASALAWAVAACLALRPNNDRSDDGASERRSEHEAWLLSQLVHCFAPDGQPARPIHLVDLPLMRAGEQTKAAVPSLTLDSFGFVVLPDNCRRIEAIEASYGMACDLPYSLRSIGSIRLYRCNNSISVPSGVTEVDLVLLDESYLDLLSAERIGSVELHLNDDCLGCDNVREFGTIELNYSYFTLPPGVEKIGSLKINGSETHLPSSLRSIGEVFVEDENREPGDSPPPRTVHWQEGPTEVGPLQLCEGIKMTLPRSIQTIASVRLATGAHLNLSQDSVITGSCEIAEGAILERLSASQYERVEQIDLTGDEAFEVLGSVRSIGYLGLFQCDSFTMPEGVLKIDEVVVDESYLRLPKSVKRVGRVLLRQHDNCLQCDGVTEFGPVQLTLADHAFPEGVETIASLRVEASACRLPATLRSIGDVSVSDDVRTDRGDGNEPALTIHWLEGPTSIGSLELGEEITMALPRSIKTIASLRLAPGSQLTLSQGTAIIGDCEIVEGATLKRVPNTL